MTTGMKDGFQHKAARIAGIPSRGRRCIFPSSLFLLFFIAMPALASVSKDYVGQYVLRLGAKNFAVLNLGEVNGNLTGTVARPSSFSFGMFLSNISSEVLTEPIFTATMEKDHLHLVAKNLTDPTDTDSYDVTLLTPSRVSLQMLGIQIDRWILERAPASPALSVATDWDSDRVYYADESAHSNPEMDRIIGEDQKPRQKANITQAEWSTINNGDKERREAVRKLLAQNALHNGKDFGHAAFVFQHSDTSDDFLLAHTLAMVAVARGDAGALWIATATLDRYLDSIKRPQIYGTQFHFTKDIPWTQEPYNRNVISDDLRHQLGVPSQAEQQKQLEQYKTNNQH